MSFFLDLKSKKATTLAFMIFFFGYLPGKKIFGYPRTTFLGYQETIFSQSQKLSNQLPAMNDQVNLERGWISCAKKCTEASTSGFREGLNSGSP